MTQNPSPTAAGSRAHGTLLLADISGYTGFLQGVTDAHRALIVDVDAPPAAYAMVASLLDGIVGAIVPPFHLVKFEGDAVFAVATDASPAPRGAALLACLRACHAAFKSHLGTAHEEWTCVCDSCIRINDLDLKFVLHHGEYVVQRVGLQEELLGPDVNVVHRLLKNHVTDLIGRRPYALFTDAAMTGLGIAEDGMVPAIESYDRIPPVAIHVLPLDDGAPTPTTG
jgi:class 3 adenylate cyclase